MKYLILARLDQPGHDEPNAIRHAAERALAPVLGPVPPVALHDLIAKPEGLAARPDDPVHDTPPFQRALEIPVRTPAFGEGTAARVGRVVQALWSAREVQAFALSGTEEFHRSPQTPSTLKLLALLDFHPDLGPAALARIWAHHAQLATQVHVGAQRYRRHLVTQAWSSTGEPPAAGGIAEIDFIEDADLTQRYFDTEQGRQAIVHDVGHFIRQARRLYLRPLRTAA